MSQGLRGLSLVRTFCRSSVWYKSNLPPAGNRFKAAEHASENRFAHKYKNNRQAGFQSRDNSRKQHPKSKKPPRFELEGFGRKAKEAMTSIIEQVKASEPNFKVMYANQGKLEQKHLAYIVNGLDPEKHGIRLTPNNEGHVLIKKVSLTDMVSEYSDKLAREAEQRLVEQGSRAAMRAIHQREKNEKKKSALKIVSLSWNISLSDLKNQKRAEINKRVNGGKKFSIYIDHRSHTNVQAMESFIDNAEQSATKNSFESTQLDPMELKRRNLILDELDLILGESNTAYDVGGSIDKSLFLNCSPKQKIDESNSQTQETQKQKRKQKQKQREQKTQKIDEDDLDSLYSFKIEE